MTAINIALVVCATLFAYWAVGMMIYFATKENETFAALWCMGLLYWILYAVCTPVRMIRKHWIKKGK